MNDDSLAGSIFEFIRLVFEWIGSDFCPDSFGVSSLAMGVLVVVCVVLVILKKGIARGIALIIITPICLSVIMTKGEVKLGGAISVMCIAGGLWTMTVNNLIAILTGNYWKIKTNLITGAIGLGVGLLIGAIAG